MDAREILERGRGRIADPEHWSNKGPGYYGDAQTCTYCTVSSMWPDISKIEDRIENMPAYDKAVKTLAVVIGLEYNGFGPAGIVGMRIGIWNDREGRTHGEVMDAMSRAITILANEEGKVETE